MKVPAYIVLQSLTLILIVIGFVFLSFFGINILSTESISAQYSEAMLLGGVFLLGLGVVGPVRVIYKGSQIPAEIKQTIMVQAFVFPLAGVALIFSGVMNTGPTEAWTCLFIAMLMLVSALAGFYPLSKKLPDTFYIGEMLSIVKSAGIFGDKGDSAADRAFMRWTHGLSDGVTVGSEAPDGTVITMADKALLLSSFFEEKILVLNLGSYSCPHHRKRMDELQVLMAKWQHHDVNFLTVYTAEAHPENDWKLQHQYVNDAEYTNEDDFCFYYAKNIDDRKRMAQWMIDKKHFKMDVVLDSMENSLLKAYNSWPIRLYVILEGKVAYCGDQGPFGYNPASVDKALEKLLGNTIGN